MMYGVILAGGSGSRLWPLSRELYPKQLLKFNSGKSLLEGTFLRLREIMPSSNIFSITNTKHAQDVKTQLGAIDPNATVLAEPCARNTAPAIAVSVKYIMEKAGDEIILVVPSDHLIQEDKSFKQSVLEAEKLARAGYIVTFGVKPASPHTGYGYIKTSQMKDGQVGLMADEFKEKPDLKTAKKYLESGNYFWNSGMFMFKASVFLKALNEHAPDVAQILEEFNFKKNDTIDYTIFEKMPSISVDYAIMERAKNIALVPLQSDWNDLGCWQAIYGINKKDKKGNVKVGNVLCEDCNDSLFFSSDRLLAGVGVENMVVVETSDAVMVCKRDSAQDVKKIYDKLKEIKDETYLIHTTVYRPWGHYTVLNRGEGYLTKMICVNPNAQLSLQSHNHRSEHWVVLSGCARVTLENKTFMLKAGSSIDIPVLAKHSLANPYSEELKIIEVQKGDKLTEDDIIRYKDIYGRVKV